MKYLRLLRKRLYRELSAIHRGKFKEATRIGALIEISLKQLENLNPDASAESLEKLYQECAYYNELIMSYLESEKGDLTEELKWLEIDKKVQKILKRGRVDRKM